MGFFEKSEEIVNLKKEVSNKLWYLSKRLNEMKQSNEYLCEYGSWTEYLVEGINISPKSSFRLMNISNWFDDKFDWNWKEMSLIISVENHIEKQGESVLPKKKRSWF